MGDSLPIPSTENEDQASRRVLSWLIFTAKGFVFPIWSGRYYKTAAKKALINAIAFFMLFAFAITIVQTVNIWVALRLVGDEIQGADERSEVPTIVIENGVAQVDGVQPLIFEDARSVFAIDTTGQMNEIDTRAYSEGLLLTRTELHILSDDGYEVVSLVDLNEIFGNPIVLDKASALTLWNSVAIWFIILIFIVLLIWNALIRFIYIVMLGLIIWGIVSIKRKGIEFSPILITGIFANVPVIYLKAALDMLNLTFFTLYTILLVAAWFVALKVVLRKTDVDGNDSSAEIIVGYEE